MNLIFSLQINIKDFKLLLSFQVCVARHAQTTQNNKFAISLQYLKKEVSDEVDFLHADKHESFLQIDAVIFYGGWSSVPKEPKISLQYLCNISRKTGRMKLIFCLQINIKDFFKLILSFQVCVAKNAQITQIFDGDGQAFPKLRKQQVCNVFT